MTVVTSTFVGTLCTTPLTVLGVTTRRDMARRYRATLGAAKIGSDTKSVVTVALMTPVLKMTFYKCRSP